MNNYKASEDKLVYTLFYSKRIFTICYIVGNMLMRIGIVLLNINEYFHKEQVLLMLFRKLCIFLLS